ncbi:MAG: hypothetical protein JO127_02795 [Caulobacteraceae bacterium]|nr:hypothetical protein [Caulobacteraceae bacterium]
MEGSRAEITRAPRRSALRALALVGGAIAWAGAAAVGAVLALVFAATVVVISLMGVALLALAGVAMRTRRSIRASADPGVIEARHLGGHSWVAYGWDGGRR